MRIAVTGADVRKYEGFVDKMASYLEQGYTSVQMYRALALDFPDADMPASMNWVNHWLQQQEAWSSFVERFGREHAQKLWKRNRKRITRPHPQKPQTLEQMLGTA